MALACVQVALAVIWHLLTLVSRESIFSARSLRWVDVIAGCAGTVTLLTTGILIHLIGIVQLGGPGMVLLLTAGIALGVALVLLMIAMRGLLEAAIADRDELAEVI